MQKLKKLSRCDSTERLNNFLDTYNFYSNNIDFRIVSSKAIEKFKNVQAFQLNQITNGKFFFKKDRKEVLLLKYDMWTRWIYEIENLFIELLSNSRSSNKLINRDQINHIINLADKMNIKIKDIMLKENGDYFDPRFINIWIQCHKSVYEIIVSRISDLEGCTYHSAFQFIVDNLIELMRHTLIEIHELNSIYSYFEDVETYTKNYKNDLGTPFLVFTHFDRITEPRLERNLLLTRLDVYRKFFDIKEVFVKNYSEMPIDPKLFDEIESRGVKINYKLNF
ncbi:hypothetical protein Va1_305 [Vibrio phage Va1]|nr:hypothetical protein Va1_305 [Vibrio phage Va1]